jgi:hypothetical protein
MTSRNEHLICVFCRGRLITENRQLAFRQSTNKGDVFCRVSIIMDICTRCGFKSWGNLAETIIEDAVRQEYDKLP